MTDLLERTVPTAVTTDTVREIADISSDTVVTVVIPTEQATPEPQRNALRLKNAIQQLTQQLADRGVDEARTEALLAPLERMRADDGFWECQLQGLYVTVWDDGWRAFRLPYDVSERTAVDVRAHLQPLLPALATQGYYYVLALSQQHVRLLRCVRTTQERIDLEPYAVPASIEEIVTEPDEEPSLQHHHGSGPGGDMPIFHGHGGTDSQQVRVEKFLLAVRSGVDKALAGTDAPVVLAGVDPLLDEYRRRSTLHTLVDGTVGGNPDERRDDELRTEAWPLVEPLLRRPMEEAVEQFQAAHGTGLALADLGEVLNAAVVGRVQTLLVRQDAERWGRFEPADYERGLHAEPTEDPDGENLVEQAIAMTLTRSGGAFVLEPRDMPADSDVAAVCRY